MTERSSAAHDRAHFEHLVDRVLNLLLPTAVGTDRRSIVSAIHQARSARRSGDHDLALSRLFGLSLASAPRDLACWAYSEWAAAVRQMGLCPEATLYRPSAGQAAVLEPDGDRNCLRVVAALGMPWRRGHVVSRRCLRGLVPLASSGLKKGGVT